MRQYGKHTEVGWDWHSVWVGIGIWPTEVHWYLSVQIGFLTVNWSWKR